ncbi:MAG TPA: lipoprotein-releasing ABC transporter permease subunit [Rhodanobacteraceae bacterium]|nr:lipoprotein-releasing ABC transporter permease subunit [Rhodanobacteraceae bacterium]
MFRPLELFIGLRYTRAKRRNHFISFISIVSIVCIAISVTALITVMSVMNGFDSELRSRILGMVSHATISGVGQNLADWPRAVQIAKTNPHVRGAAPYVEREAFLRGDAASQGAIIRGVLPDQEPQVADIGQKMVVGKLADITSGSWGIILGKDLALNLGVGVGDKVVVYAPEFNVTPVGVVPRLKRFTVVGIFEAGMQEYDSGLAVINMHDAEKLYNMPGPSGIRLRLDDMFRAYEVAHDLADRLGQSYRVQTWMEGHANFFKAVAMEKLVMFIILSLIILVAVINLISMLMMLVTDKQADIAILRTLGATPRSIMGTFMVQGMLVGIVGIGVGVGLGSLLSWKLPAIANWIQNVFHVQFLSPDVYYISDVPSKLLASDVGWVALVTFIFALGATIYPAWRASRTQPAQALRYE